MPKVSVVVTIYNSMSYFPEALNSVLGQTLTDLEVIVVDDGSTDQPTDWLNTVDDSRIRYVAQANQGVSVARNTGISHAQGEYIALLDGDDLWDATKLEKQVELMDRDSTIGLVHTWLALIDEKSHPTGRVMKPDKEGRVWKDIVERNMVACSSAMVRRCCFDTVGVFDASLSVAEDWDLWIRIAADYPFAVIKEALVMYRNHGSSKSKNYPAMVHNFRTIIERAFESSPQDLLHLRNRSYGRINLCIAWKCIQNNNPDLEQADYFCRQATLHYPKLYFSREYLHLVFAIALMRGFGTKGYDSLLNMFNILRRKLNFIDMVN